MLRIPNILTERDLHSAPMGYDVTLNSVTSETPCSSRMWCHDWATCAWRFKTRSHLHGSKSPWWFCWYCKSTQCVVCMTFLACTCLLCYHHQWGPTGYFCTPVTAQFCQLLRLYGSVRDKWKITEHWWKDTDRGKPKKPKYGLSKVLTRVSNPSGQQLNASAQTAS